MNGDALSRELFEVMESNFLDRAKVAANMDEYITVPQNSDDTLYVFANEKGTGFRRDMFDEERLDKRMNQKQYLEIIDECSNVLRREYSHRRRLETRKVTFLVHFIVWFSLLVVGMVFYMVYTGREEPLW